MLPNLYARSLVTLSVIIAVCSANVAVAKSAACESPTACEAACDAHEQELNE